VKEYFFITNQKPKMNWGKSIVLVFILFAGFVSTLAYRMITAKVDLVSDDYYQRGVSYDKHIRRLKNTSTFDTKKNMYHDVANRQLRVSLPTTVQSGEITFFRPADRTLDFSVPLSKNANSVFGFSTQALAKGRWKIQVIWNDGRHEYFLEETLDLP
jgi:hypothetical protein